MLMLHRFATKACLVSDGAMLTSDNPWVFGMSCLSILLLIIADAIPATQ